MGFARTIFPAGLSFIPRTGFIAACGICRRSLVFAAGLSGGFNPRSEISGSGSSRDGRLALVGGGTQFGITAGLLDVLHLCAHWTDVVLVSIGLFVRVGARFDPTASPVVADMRFGDVHPECCRCCE